MFFFYLVGLIPKLVITLVLNYRCLRGGNLSNKKTFLLWAIWTLWLTLLTVTISKTHPRENMTIYFFKSSLFYILKRSQIRTNERNYTIILNRLSIFLSACDWSPCIDTTRKAGLVLKMANRSLSSTHLNHVVEIWARELIILTSLVK